MHRHMQLLALIIFIRQQNKAIAFDYFHRSIKICVDALCIDVYLRFCASLNITYVWRNEVMQVNAQ